MDDVSVESMRRLLAAIVDVGAGLDLAEILHRVVDSSVQLAGARYGALGVLDPTGTRLEDFITVGVADDDRERIGPLPVGHGILGLLIRGDEPIRLDDLTQHPAASGFPRNHPKMGSFLGVPIRVRDHVFGNLYLTEKAGGGVFTESDEQLVVGLATAAGVAIDNARLHERVQMLALAGERERIGRDLHDTVIQRLFAVGLSLQTAQAFCSTDPEEVSRRINAAVDDLDQTVKHVRSVIFGLAADRPGSGLRDHVLEVCDRAASTLGFRPGVAFNGAVDSLVRDKLAAELLATLGEALTNVAKHAHASAVDVIVSASTKNLELAVRDNGVGGAVPRDGGQGLGNMVARAESLGGECTVQGRRGGTTMVWRVPIQA